MRAKPRTPYQISELVQNDGQQDVSTGDVINGQDAVHQHIISRDNATNVLQSTAEKVAW